MRIRNEDNLVLASGFHPLRGHVADGIRVKFQSGEELTVRSSMRGWKLVNDSTGSELGPFEGAIDLTVAIVRYDQSPASATT